MEEYNTVSILMVDDDSLDVELFKRSLKKNKIANPLVVAHDGLDALEALESGRVKKPFLVVLDLNMPRMNGIEFLQEIRKSEQFNDSIVFVMTTSNDDQDRVNAYNLNVAGYMVKSEIGSSFLSAINLLDNYWKTIQLPR